MAPLESSKSRKDFSPLSPTVSRGDAVKQKHITEPIDALNFPQFTEQGPATTAYQEETQTGLVDANEAEAAIPEFSNLEPTNTSTTIARSQRISGSDLEKGGFPKKPEEDDTKLVTFTENDPENPRNFPVTKKWLATICASLLCFNSGFASSIITGGLDPQVVDFNVSAEIINLTVCVFVIGFGVGPLLFAPLSEIYGRRIIYLVSMGLFIIFTVPSAVTHSVVVLIVFRFFAGFCASAPMTNAAGTIADVWDVRVRGNKMAAFSTVLFASPCLGPPIGGYIAMYTTWRWIYYVLMMLSGVCWIFTFFFLRETYAPRILAVRAKRLRKETGDLSIMTEQERRKRPLPEIVREALLRPLIMLFTESIMIFFSAYLCLIYGLLYGFFFAIPIIFQKGHGFSYGQTGLVFFGILIGIGLVGMVACPMQDRYYVRKCDESPTGRTVAETRLPLMMICSIILPASLFIFAWTSMPYVSWVGPAVAGIPFGFGLVGIYIAANSYLIDTYSLYGASAMAAKTFIRSLAGASMPMWIGYMYARLGNAWAGSLMAFIAVGMAPIPFVFYLYGARIRAISKMAT